MPSQLQIKIMQRFMEPGELASLMERYNAAKLAVGTGGTHSIPVEYYVTLDKYKLYIRNTENPTIKRFADSIGVSRSSADTQIKRAALGEITGLRPQE